MDAAASVVSVLWDQLDQVVPAHRAGNINEVQELDKSKNYYVYCKAGARSGQACSVMNHLGFKNTYNLIGGITEWSGEVTSI